MDSINMNEEISKSILKTGTTLVGILCKDGAVIASDRRVSIGDGHLVAQKDFAKVRKINDYLLMAIAGTASDAVLLSKIIAAELKLKHLKTRSRPTIKESVNLLALSIYRNIRTPSMIPNIVGTIAGGFDEDGSAKIFSISTAGDLREINDYDASGSGMTFVIGLLERQFKKDMSIQEGIELAKECIKSSTQRDTASGNGLDVWTITRGGIKHAVSEEILPQYK